MTILTKYSNTQDTQSKTYSTQKQYIESLNTTEDIPLPDDFRTPFTYKQWVQRNAGIIPGKEYAQYNQYLKSWHQNTYTVSDTIEQVQEDYYALINELSVVFSTPEEAAWFAELDITNDLDLEEAIPMFTKKLKEIAIYFINKRDAVKKAKLKYNMVGSKNALKRLFYEYLLKAFTQRQYVLNVPEQSAYDTFPALTAVRDGFQLFIEELYDDTSYFDKDPTVPISSYYDFTDANVIEYYNNLSFELSSAPWLFQTGISEIHSDDPLLWTLSGMLNEYNVSSITALPLSTFSAFDGNLLNKYVNILTTQKYLGEQQYIISGGYYELDVRTVEHDFISGNNWFYWPSGEYFKENINDIIFDPISLSSCSLISDGASAATDYRDADKVFTQVGQSISGAWLRYTEKYIQDETMYATLFTDDNTRFRFPFPGYGLSGEGVEWTGAQLTNVFPMDRYDDDIVDIYWKTIPTSAIETISIHDTTLIDSGAYATQEYNNSDEVSVRITPNVDKIHDINPNETYKEKFDRAWLYRMLNTDLPLLVGKNYINWPIHTYDKDDTSLSISIPSSQCVSIPLISLNVEDTMIGARAGYGVYDSDLIYKLDSSNGYPTECAWLSGTNIDTLAGVSATFMYNATGKIQPSLTLRCKPGNFETFVWHDQPTYINSTTICHHEHQVDCTYYVNTHKSIYSTKDVGLEKLLTNGIGGWNDCTCRAIKYSPLGHPGDNYSDYSYMTDIVFVDTQFPDTFDIDSWRGTDSLPYNTSKDFAFFKLSGGNTLEPDVGWGPGAWKTGDDSEFQFNPGVVYKYLRANLYRNPGDLLFNAVPELIIKQQYTNTPSARWMKAIINSNGNWEGTEERSPMILDPGDYIIYDHIDSNWYCLSSEGTAGFTYTESTSTRNIDSEWANYDYVTIDSVVNYLWPSTVSDTTPTSHVASELSAVTWTVTPPVGSTITVSSINPFNYFAFIADQIGTYVVTAIGYGPFGTESTTVTPNLTCVDTLSIRSASGSLAIETVYNDRINMLINIPLTGWNYTTNAFDGISLGARPFWAKSYDNSSTQNKQKGTMKWGGGIRTTIDDYTLVTQPNIATLSFVSNCYVDYIRRDNNSIIWEQPVEFIVNEGTSEWCKLVIDPSRASPLDDYLFNITNEMIVSATTVPTDIIFTNENDMFVNYWANGDFTWNQQIVNSTNGAPPTGGKWIPAISGNLVTPLIPCANLTNRHFPTIATAPYVGNLYNIETFGGYFIPKMLGASIYIGRDWTNVLDPSVLSDDVDARGITASFRDVATYIGNDRGLSHKNQLSPIVNIDSDQRWQKATITEGLKAGEVVGVKEYQTYIPYQTKYESTGFNFNGLRVQSDLYDPFTGDFDITWADPTYFPPNFRNEYDIIGWYNNKLPEDTFIFQWKTDIFGNQYTLLKDTTITGVYNKRQAYGEMWMRNQESIIAPISAIFPTYDLYQDSISSVNYSIKDFDLWFDTLMLKTSSHVIIEHLSFDWVNNTIYTIADNIDVIDLQTSSGGQYGGHYLFDEEKLVTFCQVLSDVDHNTVYPILYNYDIDSIEKTTLFNLSGNSMINDLSALQLSVIEEPKFSYNENTKTYNISFIGYSDIYTGIIFITMNINNTNGLENVYAITPSLCGGPCSGVPFKVTFLTGLTPTNINLNGSWTGPARPNEALYDSGDGIWHTYTTRNIPVSGSYVQFAGDWRTSLGTYQAMFYDTFNTTNYTCSFSGSLRYTPTNFANCYQEVFRGNKAVVSIIDNPLPKLTGSPAVNMFRSACNGMTGVTNLPTGFMDTSGLTGSPAADMFHYACYNMSGVTNLPTGFMDTSGLTGSPAAYMFYAACQNMSGVTNLPTGFMDTSGLTGSPAAYMFRYACSGMSGVTNAYVFNLGAGITFDSTNVVTALTSAFRNMPSWGGQVMWGANVLVEAIPIPNANTDTFLGSINMPNYATINANWK